MATALLETINRKLAAAASAPSAGSVAGRVALAAGLLAWLAAQGVLVGVPLASRSAPPETDDAYTYISKAQQMRECFRQDCPALRDLRSGLKAPSSDPQIAWQRYRAYTRCFLVYTPLYSAGLWALKAAGLSWESAYTLAWALGPLLFGLAFAYWLSALWGPAPAGIALALLSVHVFPGQGLHYVTPTNLTLALAAVVWGRVVRTNGRAPFTLAAGCFALAALHPTGRLYALAAIALAILLAGLPRTRRELRPYWAPIAAVVFWWTLPFLFSRPEMRLASEPFASLRNALTLPFFTLEKIVEGLDRWSAPFGSSLVLALLAGAGFLLAAAGRRRALAATGVLLSGLLAASLLHVMPRYPAELFQRFWVPFVVFMTGAVGQAAWSALGLAAGLASQASSAKEIDIAGRRLDGPTSVSLALVLGFASAALLAKTVVVGCGTMRSTIVYMRDRQSLALAAEQPALLLRTASPEDRVLYLNEIPMYFYFSHGAMRLGAAFYPSFASTEDEAARLSPRPRFAVGFNPIRTAASTPRGLLDLSGVRELEVEAREPASAARLLIKNEGPAARVRAGSSEETIPARSEGWIRLRLSRQRPGPARIEFPDGSSALTLAGLALDEGSLRWPWRQAARVTLVGSDGGRTRLDFDARRLLPDSLSGSVEVLDDQGSTVLLRLGSGR